ncbi:hypothetical protein STA1M1_37530 [Sinisalibacter aestuarii]|uniref:Uncharacterized protein n=1 Tax=Sinisalibacter aestuarii TaxID=2949426 RepID=A0ABQ5LY44_9RHOB|nr:hypothetical protein STA1M1_37530 [Sinisalibacter aestuarii]
MSRSISASGSERGTASATAILASRDGRDTPILVEEYRRDPNLLKALLEAHRWAEALRDGVPLNRVAHDAGHHDALIRTRGQFAFLAPKIQHAIRDGALPPELTLKRIPRHPIPLDWDDQARMFGI